MPERRTEAIRRWAHEEAFTRAGDPPDITCDEILQTLDELCDEVDGTRPRQRTIDHLLISLNRVMAANPAPGLGGLDVARDGLCARMRQCLYAAWAASKRCGPYEFDRLLTEALDATIETWETRCGSTIDSCVRAALAHIACVPMADHRRRPLDVRVKKGLVCWLVATSRLPFPI